MNNAWVWFAYLLGVALTISAKLLRLKRDTKLSFGQTLLLFFFLDTSAKVTTFTVLGVYFIIGHWYVAQTMLPVHWSWAFFIGTIAELTAPRIVQKVVDVVADSVAGGKG